MTDAMPEAPEFRPADDRLRYAEAEVAIMKRTQQIDDNRLGQLLALAQDAMADFQQSWMIPRTEETYNESSVTSLIAASRIAFDLASLKTEEIDNAGRERLLILASIAYGMYGNFPSAAATLNSVDWNRDWSSAEIAAVTLAAPNERTFSILSQANDETQDLIAALRQYFRTGERPNANHTWSLYRDFARSAATAWDGALTRSCRTVLAQNILLAVSRLKRLKYGPILGAYVENIIQQGRYTLLPPQYDLIWKRGFLEHSSNSLVTLPTSTGKTLLAELAIAKSLSDPGTIAIYVAPYIALGQQVFDCIRGRAPAFVDVRGHFGAFNSSAVPISTLKRTILVVTPERLDGLLRTDPSLYSRLRAIVFDEAHGIENGARGLRLESLIARIKLQQRKHTAIRIILLSAVLTNGNDVAEWLGDDAVHYTHSWRPTARRIAFWFNHGRLSWLYGNDPLRPSDRSALNEVGGIALSWPSPQNPSENFGSIEAQKPGAFANISLLAQHVFEREPAPLLIACATKASTRGVAGAIAANLEEQACIPEKTLQLIGLIQANYAHLKPLAAMLAKGVAYHNASLPSEIRSLLERAINDRELNYISATTTLAEGVDMPFRSTIVFEWLTGFKDRQAPMSPLVFRNIAGRCGRAGQFVEGDTIVYDNVLGNLTFTSDSVRRQAQARLLGDPPPLMSAANDNLTDEALQTAKAILSSQLIASIPENPTSDRVDHDLANSMYAKISGQHPEYILEGLRTELLDDTLGEPFAKAASPMWLTPLGEAANRTGFSTQTCRKILGFLSVVEDGAPNKLASDILLEFGLIDEQGNYLLRNIASQARTQFYVKHTDLAVLAEHWLLGTPYIDIFTSLPAAIRSTARITPSQWAQGVEYERISSQHDKFVELLEYAFGNYLLRLLRAFAELSPFSGREQPEPDWTGLADLFETARQLDDANVDNAIVADGLED